MLRWFNADLHVHTCLSPCADVTMSPRRIVAQALRRGLNIIAVTDHNSAENVRAVARAAEGTHLLVLAGMEVCTREEVHVLAIFGTEEAVSELQAVVYSHLGGVNEPEVFGMQVVANAEDEVEGFQERLLIGATDISIDDIVRTIHAHEGLAIAAHIDRESFGIIGQLGFIPDVLPFDGLEISQLTSDEAAAARFPEYRSYPWTRSSDAHTLDRIGSCTSRFLIAEPTFGEICDALHNRSGRAVATAGA